MLERGRYYTLGQMTNHMTELFALKSIGSEVLLSNASATPPRGEQLTLSLSLTLTLTRYEQALRRVAEQVALGIGLG